MGDWTPYQSISLSDAVLTCVETDTGVLVQSLHLNILSDCLAGSCFSHSPVRPRHPISHSFLVTCLATKDIAWRARTDYVRIGHFIVQGLLPRIP